MARAWREGASSSGWAGAARRSGRGEEDLPGADDSAADSDGWGEGGWKWPLRRGPSCWDDHGSVDRWNSSRYTGPYLLEKHQKVEEEDVEDDWDRAASHESDEEAPRIWVSGTLDRPVPAGHVWYDDGRWGNGRDTRESLWDDRNTSVGLHLADGNVDKPITSRAENGYSQNGRKWQPPPARVSTMVHHPSGQDEWSYKYALHQPHDRHASRDDYEKHPVKRETRFDLADAPPLGVTVPTPQRRWLGYRGSGWEPAWPTKDASDGAGPGAPARPPARRVGMGRGRRPSEEVLETMLGKFECDSASPAELVLILRSMASSGCPHQTLDAVVDRIAPVVDSLEPEELSECAWSLAELGLHNTEAMEAVLVAAVRRHAELGTAEASRLAWPASEEGPRRGPMLHALLERLPEVFGERAAPPLGTAVMGQEARLDDSVRRRAARGLAARARALAPRALAAALWALAALGLREGRAATALAGAAAERLGQLRPEDLASLSWALGTLGLRSTYAMEALAQEVLTRSWEFACNQLVQVVFGFAALGLRHTYLMEKVAWEVAWKAGELGPSELVHIAWAFATLACPEQRLFASLAISALDQIESFDAEHLATLAWSFASLRLRHGRLMHAVAQEAALIIEDFDGEDLSRLAWAFTALDLAPVELTQLLAHETSKRVAGYQRPETHAPDQPEMASEVMNTGISRWQQQGWSRHRSTSREAAEDSHGSMHSVYNHWASSSHRDRRSASPCSDYSSDGCAGSSSVRAMHRRGTGSTRRADDQALTRDARRASGGVSHEPSREPSCDAMPGDVPDAAGESTYEAGGTASGEEFPHVEAARRSTSELKKLPPPRRVPQRKRKKQALQALRDEAAQPGATAAAASAPASAAVSATVAEEDEEEDDFDESAPGAHYDLLDEALGDSGDEPGFDALLATLREQMRATYGETLVGRLTDTQVISRASIADLDGSSRGDVSREDQERVMKLLEARRMAETAAAGKHRHRKHKDKSERKLGREYIKTEIKNAYNAQMNQNVRYYNSVAIRVHKGEKAVDVKTIAKVAEHQQEGIPENVMKLSKEDRCMVRRCA